MLKSLCSEQGMVSYSYSPSNLEGCGRGLIKLKGSRPAWGTNKTLYQGDKKVYSEWIDSLLKKEREFEIVNFYFCYVATHDKVDYSSYHSVPLGNKYPVKNILSNTSNFCNWREMEIKCWWTISRKYSPLSIVHACNPNTLRGWGRRIEKFQPCLRN